MTTARLLRRMYDALYQAYGPQGWWPGRTRTEVVVGAILTQNTNWRNVEKAIASLEAAGLLDWAGLRDVPVEQLAERIRPAGYFRVKTRRLKNFAAWLWDEFGGNLEALLPLGVDELRPRLLAINGVGPETADSILLYALDKATFVIDAYTARVLCRHRLAEPGAGYHELKALFEDHLPSDVAMFNEYHALLVAVGKRHCKARALCDSCPLESFEHDMALC